MRAGAPAETELLELAGVMDFLEQTGSRQVFFRRPLKERMVQTVKMEARVRTEVMAEKGGAFESSIFLRTNSIRIGKIILKFSLTVAREVGRAWAD
jgi:hypothetical protein